jgi:hypothetical protein
MRQALCGAKPAYLYAGFAAGAPLRHGAFPRLRRRLGAAHAGWSMPKDRVPCPQPWSGRLIARKASSSRRRLRRPRRSGRAGSVAWRRWRRIGSAGCAAGGFAAGLGWAFAGSLWLRLGTGDPANTVTAWRWLAGEGLIVLVTMALLWLASEPQEPTKLR